MSKTTYGNNQQIQVGTPLYLHSKTGYFYVDYCKDPYTVIGVKGNTMTIQAAAMIFPSVRYFDTLPSNIYPDPKGEIKKLKWSEKDQAWYLPKSDISNKKYAVFGEYKYQPYLD